MIPAAQQTLPLGAALQQAVAHHQAGRLQEAEQLYRAILHAHPNHPDANHNLGVLAVQVKQPDAGLPHLKAALEANPNQKQYRLSYIDALIQAGQTVAAGQMLSQSRKLGLNDAAFDELAARLGGGTQVAGRSTVIHQLAKKNTLPVSQATPQKKKSKAGKPTPLQDNNPSPQEINSLIALYDGGRYTEAENLARAMAARFPMHGFSWRVLGVLFMQMGKSADALASMQNAAALSPDNADVHSNLGTILSKLGRLNEAADSFRRALQIKPDFVEAHYNLGEALQEMGQMGEAEASYRQALEIKPDLAEVHSNLGVVLKELGRPDEAEASYRRALGIKPDIAEVHNNLGYILKAQGRLDEAEASCRQALQINPDFDEAHNNLGITLKEQGRLNEAEAIYRRALQLKPDFAEVHYNLGISLHDMHRLGEAEASYRRALEIKPDYADAHSNLGSTLMDMGKLAEAEDSFRRALEIKPDYADAHSSLLFSLNYASGHTPSHCLAEARQYGQTTNSKIASRFAGWSCAKRPERLKVGLVSGDFRNHPVGYFLENLLVHLDQSIIDLVAYPTNHRTDDFTARIKPLFGGWKPLSGKSDEAAARLIHADGVHILLDLSGHTQYNRLPMFAWKPAPVQVSWLGYFATTGVATIDYLIADPWTLPETEETYFTEKIWRLPETRLCFTPPDVNVEVSPLPALSNGYVTFGCFNNLAKMNDDVVALWARILKSVPGSRLFLKAGQLNEASVRQNTIDRFAAHGIGADSLVMEGPELREKYLAAYHRVDIALDPFPYTGGTTSVEGLWMGVPVLTLAGERFLSRQGVGILMNAGLPEWVASDTDDYVTRAIEYANDLQRLSDLRGKLRSQVLAAPLFDAPRFARHFEAALHAMWQMHSDEQKSER